jgi:branched-chain amino acid aminotransferase
LTTDARRIDLPVDQSESQVRERLMELLRANEVVDGCARIYLVYNKVGIWSSREHMPTVDLIMYTIDLPVRVGPVKLGVQLNGRHAGHPLAGTKVTSWLQNIWLAEQAHARGFEDMVLVNERDEVAECTAGNLFCVKAGSVFTPPLSTGCLAGVSRQILLGEAERIGISISEHVMGLEEFLDSDEIFITSTTRQVQPVSHIEQREFVHEGEVTRALAKLFDHLVDLYLASEGRVHSGTLKS